ncbi:MAG: hypothetical protein CMJ31_01805 [Phycisphaerae bacterium]|nr:hypothetical protein [Phycisphaerae bacterium]
MAFAIGAVNVAPAQDAERSSEQTLSDFIHFVRIGNYEVAEGLGRELLALPGGAESFVELVDESGEGARFDRAVADAQRVDRLQGIAAELSRLYNEGRLALARSPEEITRNIGLLTQGLLGRSQARERLQFAGEYAMPQLLEALLQRGDPILQSEVQTLLVDMRGQAVVPLMTALPNLDASDQELVATILERIGFRQPLPVLLDLHNTTDVDAVKRATARAIRQLGGDVNGGTAAYYGALARGYFDELAEVTSFPDEDQQLLWSYDDGLGLVMQNVRTEVYHEAMAMRFAERALATGAGADAVALWLAANFSRETDTPDGYDNPAYPDSRPDAMFYAVLAGPEPCQEVVDLALETEDTTLARQGIAAIERTAGNRAMLSGADGQGESALVRALGYQNRRVRYDAALAIAGSNPVGQFAGSERVVPTLASMIRDVDSRYAVILTGADREAYDRLRGMVEAQGFRALPPADGGLGDIAQSLAEAPGVELVVINASGPRAEGLVDEVRATPKLSVAPIVVLAPATDVQDLRPRFAFDGTVEARAESLTRDEFKATVDRLARTTTGAPIDAVAAQGYIDRSIATLRDLAVSGNEVLNVDEATLQLVAALESATGELQLRVAEVLALVSAGNAQVALLDEALDLSGRDQIAMFGHVTTSVKRIGRAIERRQVGRVLELLDDRRNAERSTSVAALVGALGLSGAELAPIILEDSSDAVVRQARE